MQDGENTVFHPQIHENKLVAVVLDFLGGILRSSPKAVVSNDHVPDSVNSADSATF